MNDFIQQNWIEFHQFAKEFGIQESINILQRMDIEKLNKLLLGNYNIVLTGTPGTDKTYLAKEIAKTMNANCKLVQFHPSYDYTDFVEGLRPIKNDEKLGFERKDGVFKKFCKEVLNTYTIKHSEPFEYGYSKLIEAIEEDTKNGKEYLCSTLGSDNHQFKLTKSDDGVIFHRATTRTTAKKDDLKMVFRSYLEKGVTYVGDVQRTDMETLLGRSVDYTNWRGIIQKIIDFWNDVTLLPKAYVFIIDEINRGEISRALYFSFTQYFRQSLHFASSRFVSKNKT